MAQWFPMALPYFKQGFVNPGLPLGKWMITPLHPMDREASRTLLAFRRSPKNSAFVLEGCLGASENPPTPCLVQNGPCFWHGGAVFCAVSVYMFSRGLMCMYMYVD